MSPSRSVRGPKACWRPSPSTPPQISMCWGVGLRCWRRSWRDAWPRMKYSTVDGPETWWCTTEQATTPEEQGRRGASRALCHALVRRAPRRTHWHMRPWRCSRPGASRRPSPATGWPSRPRSSKTSPPPPPTLPSPDSWCRARRLPRSPPKAAAAPHRPWRRQRPGTHPCTRSRPSSRSNPRITPSTAARACRSSTPPPPPSPRCSTGPGSGGGQTGRLWR